MLQQISAVNFSWHATQSKNDGNAKMDFKLHKTDAATCPPPVLGQQRREEMIIHQYGRYQPQIGAASRCNTKQLASQC